MPDETGVGTTYVCESGIATMYGCELSAQYLCDEVDIALTDEDGNPLEIE
ncbi:hypothetical protein UFOVP1537_47 [uncultured Caudovirales phage]|uniref:Uncharacterized protein n=2 Tax=root TaxID=1 RepID=A0A6J5QC44_9CAUD|nr:hypothetical protein UFOVP825_12 [uncultured Caudovirales phage]CAB4171331.1 hypothetical protein UFOVP915_47 [uncultured Caudovirales phage]CAB4177194.1 hypothetical protein UFOVP1000_11 [uncultured Caudovirales phage]CAB4183149.1 hypothetical protein UFOVP1092_39 [uncultured Caudovirales phage]CAB4187670.1 hypothetical protein UFOVP1152_43 [uncultured Caudovirales phage]